MSKSLVFLGFLFFSTGLIAADAFPPGYDESADIAELAALENERMHYKLLRSRITNPADIWQVYSSELSAMEPSKYQQLKSLILDKSITELQRSVSSGALNYETLTLFYLYRLREIESDEDLFINSVIALNPNALNQARAMDKARLDNAARNPIYGMPVLLKDNIGVEGMPTTAGTAALQNNYTANAFVTTQLINNGAIILGKANLSEWAYFFCDDCPSGYSAIGGQTLNPYGRKVFGTGGSSSGSGASIAANLAVVAVGSETSGSILSPASANSLVGFKPTTGSLSRSGVVPISATLDTTGPLTRTVADAVILFNAMSGFDENDTAMPLLTDDFTLLIREVSLQGKRLGVLDSLQDNQFYSNSLALLASNGTANVNLDFQAPDFDQFTEFLGGEMVRDLALYLADYASDQVDVDSISAVKNFNAQNMNVRAPYGQALIDMMAVLDYSAEELEVLRIELQDVAQGELDALFADNQLDVLVSINNRNAGLAALANYPALTIPMGYEADGRPIGLTFIAPSYQEQELVDIGYQFEKLSQARRAPAGYQ